MKFQTALLGLTIFAGHAKAAPTNHPEAELPPILQKLSATLMVNQTAVESNATILRFSEITHGDEVFAIRAQGTQGCVKRDTSDPTKLEWHTCDVMDWHQWFRYDAGNQHLIQVGFGCLECYDNSGHGRCWVRAKSDCKPTDLNNPGFEFIFKDGPIPGMIERDNGWCIKSDDLSSLNSCQQGINKTGYVFEKIPIPSAISHDPAVMAMLPGLWAAAPHAPHAPTPNPTDSPTMAPTNWPSTSPTIPPSKAPTDSPTKSPTKTPTPAPTNSPTIRPTAYPTVAYDDQGTITIDSQATAPPSSHFGVMNYVGRASATLSANVNWTFADANKLVDGNFTKPVADTGVSYESPTCDISVDGLGYVTIDLGETVDLDGVRIFMEKGEYCNMYVNAWAGTLEEGPTVPIKGCPIKHAGALLVPTPKPSPSPTPKPTPTSTPKPSPAPTKQTVSVEPSLCFTCGDLDGEIPCTRREMIPRHPHQCPPEAPYCMNDIFQENDMPPTVYKRCVKESVCHTSWYLESSDKAQCFEYDPNIYTIALTCHLCCHGDKCNANLLPPQPTLYKPSKRSLAAMEIARQMQVQSPLCDTNFNVESSNEGITIPVPPGTKAQFIRVWSGRNSNTPKVGFLEIQPLTSYVQSGDILLGSLPVADDVVIYRDNSTKRHPHIGNSTVPPTTGGGTIAPPPPANGTAPTGGAGAGATPPTNGGGSGNGTVPPTSGGGGTVANGGTLDLGIVNIAPPPPANGTAPAGGAGVGAAPPTNGGGGVAGGGAATNQTNHKNSSVGTGTGDPHFTTFGGEKYDFHGGCDMVFLHIPDFAHGKGLRIHIRTNITTWWSSIESAAIQIGKETFELQGNRDGGGKMWFHGWDHDLDESLHDEDEFHFGGFKMIYKKATKIRRRFRISLGRDGAIGLETYKDFITVTVNPKRPDMFKGAVGLLGTFPGGIKLGRDGVTDFKDDYVGFGKEWQVLPSEPMLFSEVKGVQAPQVCAMPVESKSRKLRGVGRVENMLSQGEAEDACDGVPEVDMPACIFDVLATNDPGMAESY